MLVTVGRRPPRSWLTAAPAFFAGLPVFLPFQQLEAPSRWRTSPCGSDHRGAARPAKRPVTLGSMRPSAFPNDVNVPLR
jgi:hypothetical protein